MGWDHIDAQNYQREGVEVLMPSRREWLIAKNNTTIVDQTRFDHVRLPPLRIGSLLTCRPGCGVAGGGAPIVNRVPPGGVAADAPKGAAGCVACPLPKVNVPFAGGARFALVAEAGEDGWLLPNVKGVFGVPTGALNVNADDG